MHLVINVVNRFEHVAGNLVAGILGAFATDIASGNFRWDKETVCVAGTAPSVTLELAGISDSDSMFII